MYEDDGLGAMRGAMVASAITLVCAVVTLAVLKVLS